MGPFVSSAHPLIKAGAVTQTPADIFRSRISQPLLSVAAGNPACNIILIPSVRDLVGSSVCFPQGMFDKDDVGTSSAKVRSLSPFVCSDPFSSVDGSLYVILPPPHQRIRLLPNPCVLNINEVSIAVSSVDTLFQLRKDLFFKKAAEAEPEAGVVVGQNDMIANVCRSILTQQSSVLPRLYFFFLIVRRPTLLADATRLLWARIRFVGSTRFILFLKKRPRTSTST